MRAIVNKLLLLCTLLAGAAGLAHGQFIGYVAQQTTTQSVTIPAGTPTAEVVTPIRNLGQSAHSLVVVYTPSQAACTTWLQASADNLTWTTIASAPNSNTLGITAFGIATGYFPVLRVVANANSSSSCTAKIFWTYVGYQFPPAFQASIYSKHVANVTTAATVVPEIEYPDPMVVQGFVCFNPNASTAFVQLGDSASPPAALGTDLLYEVGIPAGAVFAQTVSLSSGYGLSVGASTTAGGSTPVGTGLDCDFQLNLAGPFGPAFGPPNSP